jgi:ADP-heptose:LPS heptosyltransferase
LIEVETTGGLGDAFITFHETDAYERICAMQPREQAVVTIISHNPFVHEIFKWHPKRDQIKVLSSKFFFHEYSNTPQRRNAGLTDSPPPKCARRRRLPIPFFASPQDEVVLASKLPRVPYLAIAPTSSGMEIENRSLPATLVETAIGISRSRDIPVVILGRNYQGPHAYKPGYTGASQAGVVDLIDQLTVPGTAHAIKRAAAVLSAHSALLLLSWYERKPTFVAYPPKYFQHDFSNPISPFVFGKDYPETDHMLFKDYKPTRFESFLDKNFR